MYNYALSREMDKDRKRVCDELFTKHSTGRDYHPDVDLLQIDTTKERHLSDVFAVINGMGYEFVHFGACRVPYGGTPSDVTK